jgi:hypothetical protein
VVRARIAVERGRPWQAAYWIGGVRDEAMALACQAAGLEAAWGRGLDRLPAALLSEAEEALVRSTGRDELLRALTAATELLLAQTDGLATEAAGLPGQLRELCRADALSG